jgi:hypothetical protein
MTYCNSYYEYHGVDEGLSDKEDHCVLSKRCLGEVAALVDVVKGGRKKL